MKCERQKMQPHQVLEWVVAISAAVDAIATLIQALKQGKGVPPCLHRNSYF